MRYCQYWFACFLAAVFMGISAARANPSILETPLPSLDGNTHKISEWKNKILIINVWATWCPPCREEIPTFIALQKQLAPKDVQFIGIAVDDKAPVADFVRAYGINYPTLLGGRETMMLLSLYGNRSGVVPQTLIFDQSGQLVVNHLGILEEKELLAYLQPLWVK